MSCRATQNGQVMVEISDKMWSTGEGNGKLFQYSCLENPINSMKRQKDMTLKDELPRSVGAQYATGKEWRNNSRKNEEKEPKRCGHYWWWKYSKSLPQPLMPKKNDSSFPNGLWSYISGSDKWIQGIRSDRQSAWWTMDGGSWRYTGRQLFLRLHPSSAFGTLLFTVRATPFLLSDPCSQK